MKNTIIICALALSATQAAADSSTLDAAIGGGIGGAAGAAVGNEIGGREGAIVGGALGGALGAAVNTDSDDAHAHHHRPASQTYYIEQPRYLQPASRFCPPGQAKKGRC